jgi:hypothetical protein
VLSLLIKTFIPNLIGFKDLRGLTLLIFKN